MEAEEISRNHSMSLVNELEKADRPTAAGLLRLSRSDPSYRITSSPRLVPAISWRDVNHSPRFFVDIQYFSKTLVSPRAIKNPQKGFEEANNASSL
jgi:hypothetical protein